MNQSTRTNPVAGIIAVVDVVLVFLMGILGNNISEKLDIPTSILLILAVIGLAILAIISYGNSYSLFHKSNPTE